MSKHLIRCLAIASCFAVLGCKKPAEPAPAPVAIPPDSWIGVELREEREPGDEIRTYRKRLVVNAPIPTSPAEKVFKEGDVIIGLGAVAVNKYADFSDLVRQSPEGSPLAVTVLRNGKEATLTVTPERKPQPWQLLRRLYVKKPFPALSGTISIAEANWSGIVEGSQCVITGESECPKIGSAGNTNLALGKVTLVIFWSQYSPGGPQALADLRYVEQSFRDKGLKIVSIASDGPEALATFLKSEPHPPMTVISMSFGDYGMARFAARENPAIFVLDSEGKVLAASPVNVEPNLFDSLEKDILPNLLRQ